MKTRVQKILRAPFGVMLFFAFVGVAAIVLVPMVFAATTTSNNNAASQVITASETDFLAMDFNLIVGNDSSIIGAVPPAGTAISTTLPADWVSLYFYDVAPGGAWNAGVDWMGIDADEDDQYTSVADVTVYTGAPGGTVGGDDLLRITTADKICTNSLTAPTCVYKLLARETCGEGDDLETDYTPLVGGVACDTGVDVMVTVADNWVFEDGISTRFDTDENLFIESGSAGLTYSATADTTIAGVAPAAATTIVNDAKPTDWTTIRFYDLAAGGDIDGNDDGIVVDADVNGFYLDKILALTADLHDTATINGITDVTNVKFWLDNGNGTFDTGTDTLLRSANDYDSGGSGWYATGLATALPAGTSRIFASMTLNGSASNGENVRLKVQDFYDANANGVFNLGDRGIFLSSRLLGNVVNTNSMTIDDVAPTLESASFNDTALAVGQTATVTFTFSEPITGFTTGDLTVPNGAVAGLASSDGGTTWTGTLTPDADVQDVTNEITVAMTGIADVPGNAGSGTDTSDNYKIDNVRPTLVSAVLTDDKVRIGETTTVTFTFSETVTGLATGDLTVGNGSVTDIATADSGLTWTGTFTPTASIESLTNVIAVAMTGVTDTRLLTDGNAGTGSTDSSNYEIDTVRPSLVSAVFTDAKLRIGETSVVTFTVSETVSGFDGDDLISDPNGSFGEISSADSGLTWTGTFTPDSDVEDLTNQIEVAMTGVTDTSLVDEGNTGTATSLSSNYMVDTVRPTLTSATFEDSKLRIGETTTVTFLFSEAVTGFATGDLTVANGAVTGLSTSDSGLTWTGTFAPDASVEDLENVITVAMTGVTDTRLDGEGNIGSAIADSSNYQIDTIRPTLVSADLTDTKLKVSETTIATFIFSEAVTGFTTGDLTVGNGAITGLDTADSGVTWTGTFTPSTLVEDTTNVITVAMTGVTDKTLVDEGNTGSSTADSSNYEIDTKRPTLEITMDDDSLIIDDSAVVTFTFHEVVEMFTNADITINNGTLTAVSSEDGITYTATLTPDASIEDTTNIIRVDMTGLRDVSLATENNYGTGNTDSENYVVDTITPISTMQYYSNSSLTTTIADNAYLKAGTYYVKVTFHEPVSGTPTISLLAEGTANDVTNASLVSVSGNIYKYTRVIATDAAAVGTTIEDVRITAVDVLGNTGTNSSPTNEEDKAIYTDTTAPVVSAGDDAGTVSATFTQTGTATDVGGSGMDTYAWTKVSGYYSVTFGSSTAVASTITVTGGGEYEIRLTATDVAGNSATDTATFTWGSIPPRSTGGGGGGAPTVSYVCSDGIDNDKDGLIDIVDPGCSSSYDSTEENVVVPVVIDPTIVDTTTGTGLKTLDLVRVQGNSSVYMIGADGLRHPFGDEGSYLSYFKDFANVKLISADDLAKLDMGAVVPYKAGSLVKLATVPKVFLVTEPNVLQWLTTESVFKARGFSFKDVHIVSDAFWSAYVIGADITQ